MSLKRGGIITDYGQYEKNLYFINSGIAQLSFLTDDFKERILYFHTENTFVSVLSSFYHKAPSDVQLSCVTNCELEYVDFEELEKVSETSLLASNLMKHEYRSFLLKLIKKQKDIHRKSSAEMYKDLFYSHPELIKRLPVKKLAHYLGIYPESLSRIRREIMN
ncbi:MAG: Crp/Fnr family transcriptional regulator [Bacteroidetes bacterium]|nr:Crp/Fnr family transcriptional regulator [Bacteroidota bacterium]